jgi:hypothetical protein
MPLLFILENSILLTRKKRPLGKRSQNVSIYRINYSSACKFSEHGAKFNLNNYNATFLRNRYCIGYNWFWYGR